MVIPMMDKDELRQLLPKVGDIRMEIPTIQDAVESTGPKKCVVTEVNAAHLWYRVRFEKSGFYECYKLPKQAR